MRNHWIWEYSMFRKFHMENDGETMVDAGVLLGIPGLRTFVTYPNSIKWIQIMVLLRHLLSLNLLRAWILFLLAFWILFSGLAKHVWTARVAAAGICSTIQERGNNIWDQDPRGYKHRSSGPGFRRLEPKGCHKKTIGNDRSEVCHLWGSHCLGWQKRVRMLQGIHAWDGTAFAACNYEGSNKKQINHVNNKIILHSFSVIMSSAICTSAWTSTVYPWPDWRFQPYGGKKRATMRVGSDYHPRQHRLYIYMFIWRYKSISQRIQGIVRKAGSFSMVWACQTLQEMDFLLVPLVSGVCSSLISNGHSWDTKKKQVTLG